MLQDVDNGGVGVFVVFCGRRSGWLGLGVCSGRRQCGLGDSGNSFFKLGSVVGEYRKSGHVALFLIYRMSRPRADSTCRSSLGVLCHQDMETSCAPRYNPTESCQYHDPMSKVHYLQPRPHLYRLPNATCPGTLALHQLCCARQTRGIELELFLGFRKIDRPPANIRRLSFVCPALVIPKMLVQVIDRFMRLGPPDPIMWTDKHRLIDSLRIYWLEASVVLRAANPAQGRDQP